MAFLICSLQKTLQLFYFYTNVKNIYLNIFNLNWCKNSLFFFILTCFSSFCNSFLFSFGLFILAGEIVWCSKLKNKYFNSLNSILKFKSLNYTYFNSSYFLQYKRQAILNKIRTKSNCNLNIILYLHIYIVIILFFKGC